MYRFGFLILLFLGLSCSRAVTLPSNQYLIANDLIEFVASTQNSLLSQHHWLTWTVPVAFFMANDRALKAAYDQNIENPIIANQQAWMQDWKLYNSLKYLFIMNTYLNDPGLRDLTYCMAEAILDSCFVAQSLKHVFGRQRPSATNDNPYLWGNLGFDPFGAYTSFPSSHATIYFSTCTVLGKYVGNEWLGDAMGVFAYVHITGHNHWMSDVWVGYLLGKAIGTIVWNQRHSQLTQDNWFIYPTVVEGMISEFPAIAVLIML